MHDPVTTPPRAPAEPGSPEIRRSGATVVDVAREAGVSVAVVSRVLNRDPALRVRDATRTRVHAVAEQLSYTPNTSARSLRLASSGAICFVVNDLANPIHAAAIEGAQASAERSGRVMLLTDADELSAHPERLQGMLDSRRVDGLVMHLPGIRDDRALRRIAQARVPTVVMNSRVRGPAGSVILDDEAASRLATEHLLELGHREIGVITALAASDRSQRRRQGVERALGARGLSLAPDGRRRAERDGRNRRAWRLPPGGGRGPGRALGHRADRHMGVRSQLAAANGRPDADSRAGRTGCLAAT